MVSSDRIRASKEFGNVIKFIRAKYLLEGKKPPSATNITRIIAEGIDREELLKNVFIKF